MSMPATSYGLALSPVLTRPAIKPPVLDTVGVTPRTEAETREKIAKTAKDFESQVLSALMQIMVDQVPVSEEFGGGAGESTFRSFMTEAMAKQAVQRSGIGLSAQVEREMLKMQGLDPQ